MHEVLVIAGGDPPTEQDRSGWPAWSHLIAADSGLDHARALGLVPDLVVGDLDSVTAGSLDWARDQEVEIATHPTTKDETDLELALDRAMALGPARITVAAVHGGRSDHFVANLALIAAPRFRRIRMEIVSGSDRIQILHGPGTCDVSGSVGRGVSLLPIHGPAAGIRTTGLQYPLVDEHLAPGSPRGMSNRRTETSAQVALDRGTLLVIEPGEPA